MSAGRITESMTGRRLLADLNASTRLVSTYQRQISSGRRMEKPSDDPLATHTAMRLRSELQGLANDRRSISDAKGWLDTTEAALSSITEVVHRARESVVKRPQRHADQGDRNKIADEIDQLNRDSRRGELELRRALRPQRHRHRRPLPRRRRRHVAGRRRRPVYRQIGPGVSITSTSAARRTSSAGGATTASSRHAAPPRPTCASATSPLRGDDLERPVDEPRGTSRRARRHRRAEPR
jgi:hypothetical protein